MQSCSELNQFIKLAVWCSGNDIGHINEVTLCRAWLVLGWVTVFSGHTTSICNQPPRPT